MRKRFMNQKSLRFESGSIRNEFFPNLQTLSLGLGVTYQSPAAIITHFHGLIDLTFNVVSDSAARPFFQTDVEELLKLNY